MSGWLSRLLMAEASATRLKRVSPCGCAHRRKRKKRTLSECEERVR